MEKVDNKVKTIEEIIPYFKDNIKIMVGGFGLIGSPLTLIRALEKSGVRNLTLISNNLGEQGKGLGKLVLNHQVKKGIGSYFTTNKDVVNAYLKNEIEIELLPQGTFIESIRAGGAGIGGFYVKTGVGTKLTEDKELREIDGEMFVFQKAIKADIALIKAKQADYFGNLIYEKSARNFNPVMATAAKVVIVEVDEVVDHLLPEEIITPHLFVDNIVIRKEQDYSWM